MHTRLTTKTVQSAALTLEGVHNIEGSDSFTSGVLSVGDGVTDNVLKEDFEHSSGLFVDESRDTLDSTTSSQSTDGGLGDTLDIVTQDLAVALGSTFAQSFSTFTTSRHV